MFSLEPLLIMTTPLFPHLMWWGTWSIGSSFLFRSLFVGFVSDSNLFFTIIQKHLSIMTIKKTILMLFRNILLLWCDSSALTTLWLTQSEWVFGERTCSLKTVCVWLDTLRSSLSIRRLQTHIVGLQLDLKVQPINLHGAETAKKRHCIMLLLPNVRLFLTRNFADPSGFLPTLSVCFLLLLFETVWEFS